MTGRRRAPPQAPGRNVAQKAGLNQGIQKSGWGLLVRRLEQKAPGRVERVPAAYTSQRCSACGHVARENRESQAAFRCLACGFTGNADVNAARNIAAGHAVKARGGDRDAGPANRDPHLQWAAPTVWTTLSLTLHADGGAEIGVPGASRFPRHWVYDSGGRLARKSGLTDYNEWFRKSFGKHTPWGDEDPGPRRRGGVRA